MEYTITVSELGSKCLEHFHIDPQKWLQDQINERVQAHMNRLANDAIVIARENPEVTSIPPARDDLISTIVFAEGYKNAATIQAEKDAEKDTEVEVEPS